MTHHFHHVGGRRLRPGISPEFFTVGDVSSPLIVEPGDQELLLRGQASLHNLAATVRDLALEGEEGSVHALGDVYHPFR